MIEPAVGVSVETLERQRPFAHGGRIARVVLTLYRTGNVPDRAAGVELVVRPRAALELAERILVEVRRALELEEPRPLEGP